MAQAITLPAHVAIVPDGNRRWADLQGVPKLLGHRAGAITMHNVVDYLIDREIKYLTLWGFSTDNWKRSQEEIESLLQLLGTWIEKDAPWLNTRGVRLRHIGQIGELTQYLQLTINHAVALTQNNSGMTLNLAFNYSGRAEIINALRRLLEEGVPSQQVDESLFCRYLYTDGIPDVDLVIRTAGEVRLSNFMLWQTAYSEFYFTPTLWPEFSTKELEKALLSYSERLRRFGGD